MLSSIWSRWLVLTYQMVIAETRVGTKTAALISSEQISRLWIYCELWHRLHQAAKWSGNYLTSPRDLEKYPQHVAQKKNQFHNCHCICSYNNYHNVNEIIITKWSQWAQLLHWWGTCGICLTAINSPTNTCLGKEKIYLACLCNNIYSRCMKWDSPLRNRIPATLGYSFQYR